MKSDKLPFVAGFTVLLLLVAGFWIATQTVAHSLGYQHALGSPLLMIKGWPLYAPWKFLSWYLHYGSRAPKQFNGGLKYIYISSACSVLVTLIMSFCRSKPPNKATSHGTANWAEEGDLKKAHLLDGKGVVLGASKDGKYLRHDGPEHVIAIAPTRSGKGVGIIIPTLLTWPHSVIVTDIKGENWSITAGYRQRSLNNIALKFDPTAKSGGVKYNPLEEIRPGDDEVRDAQNIADILVDPQGTGQLDHWAKTGHALLVGTILHILHDNSIKEKNLPFVASFLSDPRRTIHETLETMLRAKHDPTFGKGWTDLSGKKTQTHQVVAATARELLNKSENELSGVVSTAMSFLGLYRDPIVAENTKHSEFRISDLMNHDKPVSLYLVTPPSDLNRTRPLMRLIINQIGRNLTETMGFKDGKPVASYQHRMLMLLDEFPALGRLDFFESALAFLAGYGIKVLLIAQSLNQLKKTYGPNNSIMDNCHVRTVYTPNDNETAELISRMLGQKTEVVNNQSISGNRFSLWLKNTSYSTHETARQLMTSGEVSLLPVDEEIIFVSGFPPIRANKLFYFKDKNFMCRICPAPEKSDVCRTVIVPSIAPETEEASKTAASATALPETTQNAADVGTAGIDEHQPEPLESEPDETETGAQNHMAETAVQEEEEEEACYTEQVLSEAAHKQDNDMGLSF